MLFDSVIYIVDLIESIIKVNSWYFENEDDVLK